MSTHSHAPPRRQIPLGFTAEPFPEGTHICYLYSDEAERKRFMSEFISSGIDQHESVLYLADTGPEQLERAIEELGIAPAQAQQNQLTVATCLDTYYPTGEFVPERMLSHIPEIYMNHAAGCAGARATSEMTWALHGVPGSDRLVEYEAQINEVLKAYPLTTICQYDTRKFDGATIFKLLNVHPVMIVHGQIMRNPFYVPPAQAAEAQTGTR
jgi:hypothetical protein